MVDKDKALKVALEALEKICEGCGNVIEDKLHENAVTLAKLVREDCNKPITAIREALAEPEQDDGMCQACEANQCTAKQGCVALENPSQPEPDWKRLVLAHNAECEKRCNKEHCGYARYFETNGRRCPTCPVYEKIDVDTTPPQHEWQSLTDEEIEAIGKGDKVLLAQFHTSVKTIDEMKDPTAQIMNLVIRQQGFNFAKAIEAALREKNGG